MTVQELIDALKLLDKDAVVVIPGYEDGYNPVCRVIATHMTNYPDPKWYCGEFEEAETGLNSVILR